jgi:hypothetical protein
MPQRSMRACGRIPILQDETRAAWQRKPTIALARTRHESASGTKIMQTERKTCALAELV